MEQYSHPTPPRHPAHVLAKMEKRRRMTRAALLCLPVIALAVALGIWIGGNMNKPAPTEPPPPPDAWKTNILRSDEILRSMYNSYSVPSAEYPVFGSGYHRQQISAVTFLDTLSGAPTDAWDVSEAGDGSVVAWVEQDGDLYQLYIAGEGGVNAGASCLDLFAGYDSMTQLSFGGNFHTDTVQDMSCMFFDCSSLTSLDLSSFDTAAVRDMSDMFFGCESLTSLDLRSFDTAAVRDMNSMFYFCKSLTSLDLSEKFVTTKAVTFKMFFACPAGDDWQHLLH